MSFKNKNIIREFPFFSHFMCLPLIHNKVQHLIIRAQQLIQNKLKKNGYVIEQTLKRHPHLLSHLTLFMLTLRRQQTKDKLSEVLRQHHGEIINKLQSLQIQLTNIKYFTRVNKKQKCLQLTVIYLQIDQKSQEILQQLVNYLTKILLKHEIIVPEELKSMRINYSHTKGVFELETFHVSLFRCKGLMDDKGGVVGLIKEANEELWSGNSDKDKGSNSQQTVKGLLDNVDNDSSSDKIKIKCKTLDVSTMMAFDQSEFYLPLIRLPLLQKQQYEQHSKEQYAQLQAVQQQQQFLQQQLP